MEKMRDGLHTFLGKGIQDGQDLSDGQWQMVAVARTVFSGRQGLVLQSLYIILTRCRIIRI